MLPRQRAVLITGATGALGPAVIHAFSAGGWTVQTLSRTAPRSGTAAAEHPHVRADINDMRALHRAMANVDVVVHMAALLHIFNGSASAAEYERVNVDGTRAVISAAVQNRVQRVVALSSIAVYGSTTEPADEDTAPVPDTPYGATKLDAERLALQSRSPNGTAVGVVLRLASVYGPSIKGNYERLARALARRRFVPVGNGLNRRTVVFEADAAQAILMAATHPAATGRLLNVTDGEIYTVADIIAAIGGALGRRPPRLAIPLPLARVAGVGIDVAMGLTGRRRGAVTATLAKYTEDVVVSGRRIQKTLGFVPRWSLAEGWRGTVARWREEGRL